VATCVAPRRVFRDDLARQQQAELDTNAGKADSLASRFAARRNVVIPRQLAPLHPAPVVDDREHPVGRIGPQADECRARVERVGDHFGQDGVFERASVRVTQIFEQML
jgi:hypothetical protein